MKTARGMIVLSLTVVLCLGVMGVGIAAGGNGNGSRGGGGMNRGNGTGSCVASDIVTAPDVTIEGTVVNVGSYGQGIGIDTGDEIVRVFGIGPVRYWEDVLEVARPDVGDGILVTGKEVTFSDGTTKIIIFTVTFTFEEAETRDTIILRDTETGLPLWRGEGFGWRHRYLEQ
jgi:hypothetical protein